MLAIQTKQLYKTYRKTIPALRGIDLELQEGDFFGLIGANGAGKSTLIGILTGLVIKTSGTVKIFGIDIDESPELSRQFIGVVPQEFNFNIFEKIENILINQAGYYGMPRAKAIERAEELLKLLDLWDKRHTEARRLSGGMKRRLMIARALMHRPKLLLLDEPTVGVDVSMRQSTWDYLRKLNTSGMTILLTSHNLEEIEHLCHTAAMIYKGQILRSDKVENLISSLESQIYIAKLVHTEGLEKIKDYNLTLVDNYTVEVILENQDTLTNFISVLHNVGIPVKDIRPKRNRLEQLFFNLNASFEDET